MKKRRKVKLPGKLGRLLIPKNGCVEKLKRRYPEKKFTLTAVVTADGEPVGYLARRVEKGVSKTPKKTRKK
jgi:hypothetical protein